MDNQPNLNLKDLVSSIRDELEQIDKGRQLAGKEALFQLKQLELELKFVVAGNGSARTGFDIKVISFGGEVGIRTEEVHTVKITFEVPADAGNVLGVRAHGSLYMSEQDVTPIE
jgi:hypothetical protein